MGTTVAETVGSHSGVHLHVIIETSTDGTTWEQTDWDTRAVDYGLIDKSIDDWTGQFRVGEMVLQLADPDNEIYGSFTH